MPRKRSSGRAFLGGLSVLVVILGAAFILTTTKGGSVPSKEVAEQRTDTASALDVVADVKNIALGHVPLDQTVTPTWKLTNGGKGTAVLGEPHAEVIEGCCPGPLEIGVTTLEAGETTELSFPLQMHPGMDGPHEFSIHVPIERNNQKGLLELTTTGHFSS